MMPSHIWLVGLVAQSLQEASVYGSMAVDDAQEAIQERGIRDQSDNNGENEDLISTSWPPRRAAKMVLPKCSKCGKVGHSIKFCSL
jgi:hypothetical protein